MHELAATFWELVRTPFQHIDLLWGVVPLYFGWVLNELTSNKANYLTAINTGFSFLWAAAHWTYQSLGRGSFGRLSVDVKLLTAVNVAVTLVVAVVGVVAFVSGVRRKFPRFGSFLGHARFGNYFMIAIFPIQSNYLPWTWERVQAIAIFASPIWLALHFGLMPLRKR